MKMCMSQVINEQGKAKIVEKQVGKVTTLHSGQMKCRGGECT